MTEQPQVTVEFLGEVYTPDVNGIFTIGRDADFTVDDDNPFLHRQFLTVTAKAGMWWLTNIGSQLTATVSDVDGAMQAWLAPGASMPIVFEHTVVLFTAGSTTYEFDIKLPEAVFEPALPPLDELDDDDDDDGTMTVGRVALTPDQKLLIVSLCENALRRGERGAGSVPQSAHAAERLGWSVTKFNRKLDNVCSKLADLGVRGLHGGRTRLASSRKARLVEYAMSARLVTADDLALLPPR